MKIDIHNATGGGDVITLLEPLTINWRGREFTIPAGFESDGMSVPECLWATICPAIDPRTLRGALAHDFIYRIQPQGWTRKEADAMLYDLIRADGLGWWRAWKVWRGVRRFGNFAWDSSRKAAQA